MDLSTARVLVTGGAGLVGSHIVDQLVSEGASVIVYDSLIRGRLDHLESAREQCDVKVVEGDIRDVDQLAASMQGVDYVFHEAALWLHGCQSEPRKALEVNVMGTFNVLEACVKSGVKKVVAASSSSVYGDGSYFPTDEVHPFNNDLFYGATKVADEQLLTCFHKEYGLVFIGLRYLNVYGPRQPFDSAYMDVIMHFLNRLDADESPIIHGDGTQTVDLVFVEDVATANIIALKSEVSEGFFNVASGVETTLNELAEMLIELSGKTNLKAKHEHRDGKLVTRRLGCPRRAAEALGFTTKIQPMEGLRRVIEWRAEQKARKAAMAGQ
jgi:UDP-glucose 4-epimerase